MLTDITHSTQIKGFVFLKEGVSPAAFHATSFRPWERMKLELFWSNPQNDVTHNFMCGLARCVSFRNMCCRWHSGWLAKAAILNLKLISCKCAFIGSFLSVSSHLIIVSTDFLLTQKHMHTDTGKNSDSEFKSQQH